jgi:hypothetical protein
MAVLNKISKRVREQFPDFYKEEGENFLAFIEAYYEYMEQEGKLTHEIQNLESYRDISTTTDDFISYFQKTLLPSVPEDVLADKKIMAKYIKQFNQSRGTFASYKLMFRAIYNEDVELNYPADQILKVSDGDWRIDQYLVTDFDYATYKFIGKTIKGAESGAEALVEDVVTRIVRGRHLMQMLLSNIKGTFNNLEPVRLKTDTSGSGHAPIVEAGINRVTIQQAGGEYQAGDIVSLISEDVGLFAKIVVTNTIDLGGALSFNLLDGGSGYGASTDETVWGASKIEFIGGDGSEPANFTIERGDIDDTFALSVNTTLLGSNNIYGALGAPVSSVLAPAEPIGGTVTSTHANSTLIGIDTSFTSYLQEDDELYHTPRNKPAVYVGRVDTIANNTVATLTNLGSATEISNAKLNFRRAETLTQSTFANTIIGSPSYGFPEVGEEVTSEDFRDHENAWITIANTSNPGVIVGDSLFGETSSANATVTAVIRSYSNNNVVLRIDGYKNFTTSEKVNKDTSDGETVGTVSKFEGNTVGLVAVSVGTIAGQTLSPGDIVAGRTSGTTGIVRHPNVPVASGKYNSTLVVANTVDPNVEVGSILNGESSGANAVIHYIDTDYASGTVTYNVRSYGSAFTTSEKVNLVNYETEAGANNKTIGTVSSFSAGGRDLYTYKIGATPSSNVSSQFDTGSIGRFIADEGLYIVSSNTTVGNVAATAANTVYENRFTLLRDSILFAATYFGSISKLSNFTGGSGYSVAPRVQIKNNDIAALGIGEQYLTLQTDDVNWSTGNSNITKLDSNDRVLQANTSASGDVKGGFNTSTISLTTHANGTYECVVRVWQDFLQRKPNNIQFANNQGVTINFYGESTIPGEADNRTPTDIGQAKIVNIVDRGILGDNANVRATVGSNGTITALRVIDSGFSYRHNEVVRLEATNRPLAVGATAQISLSGTANAEGYYASSRSQVSTKRGFIQDSRYYQEFSYELLSPISLARYRDIALKLCHPAGQALFGRYRAVSNVAVNATANTSQTRMAQSNGTFSLTKPKASGTVNITANTTAADANTRFKLQGFSTDFANKFANHEFVIIETDPGAGLDNQFWLTQLNIVSSANTANLAQAFHMNVNSANIYYANTGTAHTLVGSGSTLTSEFANTEEIFVEVNHKEYRRLVLNKVNSATSANLASLYVDADFSGANAYYITGSF